MKIIISNDNFNIHVVENKNFKNYKLEVHFINEYDRSKLAIRETLCRMLFLGNKNYKTSRDISLRTEELYDCITYFNQGRYGNSVMTTFYNKFLNSEYVHDDNYLEDNIKYLFEIIFDGEFNEESLNFVKSSIIDDIRSIEEDPRDYAKYRANEVMDESDPSALPLLGTTQDIEKITLKDLEEEYTNFINNSSIEIGIICKEYDDSLIDIINKYAKFNNIKNELDPYRSIKEGSNKLIEEKDFSQSIVTVIYNIKELSTLEKDIVVPLFEMILGGGGLDTRLNQELREKHSLCYGAYATYSRFDNKLSITTLVNKENIDKTLELIDIVVSDMKNISEDELKRKKLNIVRMYKNIDNNMDNIIRRNVLENINYALDVDTALKLYDSITTEQIEAITERLTLNTIYVMKGVK